MILSCFQYDKAVSKLWDRSSWQKRDLLQEFGKPDLGVLAVDI